MSGFGAVSRSRSDVTERSLGLGVKPSSAGSTQWAAVRTVVGPIITPEHVATGNPRELITTPTIHGHEAPCVTSDPPFTIAPLFTVVATVTPTNAHSAAITLISVRTQKHV